MAGNISDIIEQFIMDLIGDNDSVSLSRNELAQYFDCAPSQINYVLSTRFTLSRGFITDSKRGGGGFILLARISDSHKELINILEEYAADRGISYKQAEHIIKRLIEQKVMSLSDGDLILSAITDKALVVPTGDIKEKLRANILKNVLTYYFREDKK